MNNSCSAGGSKLNCAQSAMLTFPEPDASFPGQGRACVAAAAEDTAKDCSSSQSDLSYDDPGNRTTNPNYSYVTVPLSTHYRTSDTGPINNGSTLVSTINCMQAPGGHGSSFAIGIDGSGRTWPPTTTQSPGRDHLPQRRRGRTTDQSTTTTPSKTPKSAPYRTQPCHQAITSARNAAVSGTWISRSPMTRPAVPTASAGRRHLLTRPSRRLSSPALSCRRSSGMSIMQADRPRPGQQLLQPTHCRPAERRSSSRSPPTSPAQPSSTTTGPKELARPPLSGWLTADQIRDAKSQTCRTRAACPRPPPRLTVASRSGSRRACSTRSGVRDCSTMTSRSGSTGPGCRATERPGKRRSVARQ